jgi:hypothetical protein
MNEDQRMPLSVGLHSSVVFFVFYKIIAKTNFSVRIGGEGVYLKSVSRTGMSSLNVARGKEGIVDSAPGVTYNCRRPTSCFGFDLGSCCAGDLRQVFAKKSLIFSQKSLHS